MEGGSRYILPCRWYLEVNYLLQPRAQRNAHHISAGRVADRPTHLMMRSSVIMAIRCIYCSLLKGRSYMSFAVRARILPSSNPSSEPGPSVRSALSYSHAITPCHKTTGTTYARSTCHSYKQYCVQESDSLCRGGMDNVWFNPTLRQEMTVRFAQVFHASTVGRPASTNCLLLETGHSACNPVCLKLGEFKLCQYCTFLLKSNPTDYTLIKLCDL